MKAFRYFSGVFFVFLFCAMAEAAYWGSFGSGYISDDNFYKDTYKHENTGSYYTLNLNAKNKLSRNISYDAFYLLLGRKNYNITWEDNIVNDIGLGVTARPSNIYNIRVLGSFENRIYRDPYSTKYNYNQYGASVEMPLYVLDYYTPKFGMRCENIKYDDFNYDSTATGPLFELEHELSPWTILTFSANVMTRDYSNQYLFENIITTGTSNRKDIEIYSGLVLSAIISSDWNFSTGLRYADIRSNANLSILDASVEVSSRALVADYYSYTSPSLFIRTVFYPARKAGCFLGGIYQERSYLGRYVTDSAGVLLDETRKDKKYIMSAGVTYSILSSVMLKADYSYENSSSNDNIYTYTNKIYSIGVNVYF